MIVIDLLNIYLQIRRLIFINFSYQAKYTGIKTKEVWLSLIFFFFLYIYFLHSTWSLHWHFKKKKFKSYEKNSRGLEIFSKSWLPESNIKALVFFCHGYGDTCTFFFEGDFLSKLLLLYEPDKQCLFQQIYYGTSFFFFSAKLTIS